MFDIALEAQVVFPSHLVHQCFRHNLAGNTEIEIPQVKGEGQETKSSVGSSAVTGYHKIMAVLGFQSRQESGQTLKNLFLFWPLVHVQIPCLM